MEGEIGLPGSESLPPVEPPPSLAAVILICLAIALAVFLFFYSKAYLFKLIVAFVKKRFFDERPRDPRRKKNGKLREPIDPMFQVPNHHPRP